jgi:hypothetical protein
MFFSRIKTGTIASALFLSLFYSCSDKKDDPVNPSNELELTGVVGTRTLDASKKYLLKGTAFVEAGQVLTIPAGTIIMGDKGTKGTLVIKPGGKIEAVGTADKPIIFTSEQEPGERDPGDWGGVIILGNANVNQANPAIEGINGVTYGTQNSTANDGQSSGTLKYVRIEFAGKELTPNNEINGLTFGGVGSGTVVENVQVSYSGDDAFEWFGGTVNCKNLVSFATWDDDFDTDFGYTGKVQFAVAVRDPFAADQSFSNAFESDNDAGGTESLPKTAPIFSNISVFGPRFDSTSSISASYGQAAHLRRRTATSIFNSVITGFPTGIFMDGKTTFDNYTATTGEIKNNLLVSLGNRRAPKPFMGASGVSDNEVKDYFSAGNPAGFISFVNQLNYMDLGIDVNLYFGKNTAYPANPNFAVSTGLISTGANFTHSKLSGSFFQNVPYHGAFGATDWTDSWTNFDPKSLTY